MNETENIVSLTANAVAKIKELTQSDPQAAGKSLRIYLESGGCSGYQYGFAYDAKKEGDHVIATDGIEVLLDDESARLLKGSVID